MSKRLENVLKYCGVIIMIASFPIVPDSYPWYVELIIFDIGLVLMLAPKWSKLRERLSIRL